MSYSDDDKEVKIGEEDDDTEFEVDPNDPLNEPLDDDLVGTDNDPFDSEFVGLDSSEY